MIEAQLLTTCYSFEKRASALLVGRKPKSPDESVVVFTCGDVGILMCQYDYGNRKWESMWLRKDFVHALADEVVVTTDARHIAAQAWCDNDTSMIEMDSRLAEAFARRVSALQRIIGELGGRQTKPTDNEDGLTAKEAWWAGVRVGLDVPYTMPREEVASILDARRIEKSKEQT